MLTRLAEGRSTARPPVGAGSLGHLAHQVIVERSLLQENASVQQRRASQRYGDQKASRQEQLKRHHLVL
jgi:hypothetical protein